MKIRSPLLIGLAARLIVMFSRLLMRTVRLEMRTVDPETNSFGVAHPSRHAIFCAWHDSLFVPIFGGKHHRMACLVSHHRDGTLLVNVLERVEVVPVRGSTTRGGARAVRQMLEQAKDRHLSLAPDGPRGPRRKMKDGAVFIASQSGLRIAPVAISCTRCWRPKGKWTDLLIPKPFSRVYFVIGDPISVPPDLTRDELRTYTARVQRTLDRLNDEAEELVAGRQPRPQLRAAA